MCFLSVPFSSPTYFYLRLRCRYTGVRFLGASGVLDLLRPSWEGTPRSPSHRVLVDLKSEGRKS